MEAVRGETRCTSSGASAGSRGERRSTPGWHSQLLALETSRIGVAAPRDRANSPTTKSWLAPDRKSTRLNSSHSQISYAVFCLKKKKKKRTTDDYLDTQHRQLHC